MGTVFVVCVCESVCIWVRVSGDVSVCVLVCEGFLVTFTDQDNTVADLDILKCAIHTIPVISPKVITLYLHRHSHWDVLCQDIFIYFLHYRDWLLVTFTQDNVAGNTKNLN